MRRITVKKISMAALVFAFFFLASDISELAEARSRGGGRSFGGGGGFSRSVSKPAPRTAPRQGTQAAPQPGSPAGTGAFGRGLAGGVAGGLMGGLLGNMLFGGPAHGMGMGGLGGSGLGLFELLLIAGLGYFLYKKFLKRPEEGPAGQGGGYARNMTGPLAGSAGREQYPPETGLQGPEDNDPLVAGVKQIWQVDESFHPDRFKETAQDLFFKIQAGWTRRDVNALKDLVGNQLLEEYGRHFADMQAKCRLNRLENIAVRKVDLVQAGVEAGEIFATIRFTANLLDYTVDEKSGDIVDGDRENPVKFDENWTFARPVGASAWKLEGIEIL